jgi:thioredoxin-related protein
MKKLLLSLALYFCIASLCFAEDQKKTLLIFSSKWCKFCTKMKNDMNNDENISDSLKKYEIIELDYDKDKEIANGHQVKSLPTIIIFEGGKEVSRKIGHGNAKDLAKFLQ